MQCFGGGGGSPSPAQQQAMARSATIDRDLAKARSEKTIKLLLLGAGGAGKSTFLKQLKNLYDTQHPWTAQEKETYKGLLQQNCISNMQTIINFAESNSVNISSLPPPLVGVVKSAQLPLSPQVSKAIQELWNQPVIRKLYEDSGDTMHLPSSAKFVFDHAHSYADPSYTVTHNDILMCRIPTTGAHELKFRSEGFNFEVIDVGGQRAERRKWLPHFEKVNAVIFLVASNEYDMTLEEAEGVNRLDDSLKLFAELCSNQWFKDVPFFLALNKYDLLKDKLKKKPFEQHFSGYEAWRTNTVKRDDFKLKYKVHYSAFKDSPALVEEEYFPPVQYLAELFFNEYKKKAAPGSPPRDSKVFITNALDPDICKKIFVTYHGNFVDNKLNDVF